MNAEQLYDKLIRLGACEDARVWAEGKSLAEAWNTCERGDWMLWLAAHLCNREIVVSAACDCAELALKHVPKNEDRPRKAIETARAWVRGEATIAQLKKAAAASHTCYAEYASAGAAAYAAYAAYAAALAAYSVYSPHAAGAASSSCAYAYAYASAVYDSHYMSKCAECAELVRRRIPRYLY
jgi:hypothetical protein